VADSKWLDRPEKLVNKHLILEHTRFTGEVDYPKNLRHSGWQIGREWSVRRREISSGFDIDRRT
jgi:hypothetical protein